MMQQLSNDTRHTAPSLRSVRDNTLTQRTCITTQLEFRQSRHGSRHFVNEHELKEGWHDDAQLV